jgi:hypothetical protein
MGPARNSAKGATAGAGGTRAREVAACGLWLVGVLAAARGAEIAGAFGLAGGFTLAGAFTVAGAFIVAVAFAVTVAGLLEDTAVAAFAGTALNVGAEAAAGLGAAVPFAWRPVASASAFAWSEEIARRSSDSAVAVRALG